MRLAIIGNFPPRRCGIAEFTSDFATSIADAGVDVLNIALNDSEEGYEYGPEVDLQILATERRAYALCADEIAARGCTAISLQHEFGIFGGPDGEWILELTGKSRLPIVTTLHTILQHPSDNQYRIMRQLAEHSTKLITMANKGKELLKTIYDIDPRKIEVVPHPIPSIRGVSPHTLKENLSLTSEPVLATFGLLSPNKGIEDMIRALAVVKACHPTVRYIIAGRTHPHILREHGEEYRDSLKNLTRELNLDENIIWMDRFVGKSELLELLLGIDVYVTPYHNLQQITSGTLSYAFGLGNAVVSTPYWHAQEVLSGGRGILVPPKEPTALGGALTRLLDHPEKISAMRMAARSIGQSWTWECIAHSYRDLFDKIHEPTPDYVTA